MYVHVLWKYSVKLRICINAFILSIFISEKSKLSHLFSSGPIVFVLGMKKTFTYLDTYSF